MFLAATARTGDAPRFSVTSTSRHLTGLAAQGRRYFAGPFLDCSEQPLGVLFVVLIQWYALARNRRGRPATWKGRAYLGRRLLETAQVERPIP